jgi:LysR family hydrogen peroxide-inducible transcriptional activator
MAEMLLLSEGHCLRNQVLEFCQSKDNVAASYYFESGSLETLMRIVDRTEFMTVIPEMALPYISASNQHQVKTLARGAVSRKVVIATRRVYIKERIINTLRNSIMGGFRKIRN